MCCKGHSEFKCSLGQQRIPYPYDRSNLLLRGKLTPQKNFRSSMCLKKTDTEAFFLFDKILNIHFLTDIYGLRWFASSKRNGARKFAGGNSLSIHKNYYIDIFDSFQWTLILCDYTLIF